MAEREGFTSFARNSLIGVNSCTLIPVRTHSLRSYWVRIHNHFAILKTRPYSRDFNMAERVGFEPTVPLPAHLFSRQASSTTPASLLVDYCSKSLGAAGNFGLVNFIDNRAEIPSSKYVPLNSRIIFPMSPRIELIPLFQAN